MKVNIGPYDPAIGYSRLVDVEIDTEDLYNLDHTLALVILPALKKFKEEQSGYPGGLTSDEWQKILDKMIEAFRVMTDYKISFGEKAKQQEGFELFGKYFTNLWY